MCGKENSDGNMEASMTTSFYIMLFPFRAPIFNLSKFQEGPVCLGQMRRQLPQHSHTSAVDVHGSKIQSAAPMGQPPLVKAKHARLSQAIVCTPDKARHY